MAPTPEKILTLQELVRKAGELDMMPQVARKVIDLVSNPSASAQQLAEVIEKDPNITTRILKIANSAFYGIRREVKSVQQAIVILGFKSLRSMVVASSSKALHKRFGITEQMMWDLSIGSAIGGKIISEGRPPIVGEIAFTGGLLHNIGQTVMNNECPKAYTEVMQLIYNDGVSSVEAEKRIFQFASPEVGALVTEKWGLPSDLHQIIRYHSLTALTPDERAQVAGFESHVQQALACVELATGICQLLGIGYREKKPGLDLQGWTSTQKLDVTPDKVGVYAARIEEAYNAERAIFQ